MGLFKPLGILFNISVGVFEIKLIFQDPEQTFLVFAGAFKVLMTLFYLLIRAFLISATFFKIKVSFYFRRELFRDHNLKVGALFQRSYPTFDRTFLIFRRRLS